MGMGLYLLPETASARPGFALLPFASAGSNEEVDLGESLTLSLAELDLTGGVGIFVGRILEDVSFTAASEPQRQLPAHSPFSSSFRRPASQS